MADTKTRGMGTTVTAAYVGEREVTIAHVGDSRAYVLRDGELTRLTSDHSLVGELVKRGKLTEEQAELHPQRSVITRALGSEPDVDVDVDDLPGPRRRRVHAQLRRPDLDGPGAAREGDHRGRAARSSRPGAT